MEHESVRRGLDQTTEQDSVELAIAWRRYCQVIAELDRTTSEFEALRTGHG